MDGVLLAPEGGSCATDKTVLHFFNKRVFYGASVIERLETLCYHPLA